MKNVIKAFVKAQGEFTEVYKNTKGHGYKYATLDGIINMLRPILTKNGLALMQKEFTCNIDGKKHIGMITQLLHDSGEVLESEPLHCPLDSGAMRMSTYQMLGVGITYLRRYQLSTFMGIASEEDTDGAVEKGSPKESLAKKEESRLPLEERLKELAAAKGINVETKKAIADFTIAELNAAIKKLS